MDHNVAVLHFGDQTVDIHASIEKLYRLSRTSPVLSRFLQNSTKALRSELSSSPPTDKPIQYFRTIRDLSEDETKAESSNVAVATVLLCITQLGWLLIQLEQQPRILSRESKQIMLGLCTGMLPAIAAASVTCISELLSICPELIRISLRLGIEVLRQSNSLDRTSGSWAFAIFGVSLDVIEKCIEQFHKIHQIPSHARVYLSATGAITSTVSGSPTMLKLFFEFIDSTTPQVRRTALPIFGAYHAGHIYTSDMRSIIGSSPILDTPIRCNASVLSTSTGTTMNEATTVGECLKRALTDILQLPLNSPLITSKLLNLDKNEQELIVIGPSNVIKPLRLSLDSANYQNLSESSKPQGNTESRGGDFAIVGMSGRFPGSEDLQGFWEVLEKGLDLHRKIPANRFDVGTHCDLSGQIQNTTLSSYGCFLERPEYFDARVFNMSPREAAATDPIQRLLLMTTYEALEMSGYSFDRTAATDHKRIGTFIGQTSDDYREVNASQDIDTFYVTGGIRAFGPGRLNYHFGWEGPSYSIDGACSSSMAAIQLACTALSNHECDTAVAGGGGVLTASDPFAGLSRGGFLSLTGSCKTWDATADGYCRADGVGVVVIKRLDDAIADRDCIQAVIKGISTNHSADAVSITHPHAPTQQRLFNRVLQDANVVVGEVDYIEMHGTGTQAGDVTETTSVVHAFSERAMNSHPLYIGTLKPNIGHGEAASGVASLIKAVLMFQKHSIPAHIGIKGSINPKIPLGQLSALNIKINQQQVAFNANPNGDGKRRILINNFNAAGGNTSLLLEDNPTPSGKEYERSRDPRGAHIVTVSAKTPNSLRENKNRLLAFLKESPHIQLADLAYTTTARRMHHMYRNAYVATSVPDLISSLENDYSMPEPIKKANKSTVVLLFSGQGSLYSGIGCQLLATSKTFAASIGSTNETCERLGLPSVLQAIGDSKFDYNTCDIVLSQLVLVAVEIALAAMWNSWGLCPDIVCGHSLGEYAALYAAGVLSLADTVYLVGNRALLMKKHCKVGSHEMLVVDLPAEKVQQIMSFQKFSCEVACINGPEKTVVSGTVQEIGGLMHYLRENSVRATRLQVPYAFHSSQLDSCLDEFELLAQGVSFNKPRIHIASSMLGAMVSIPGVFNAKYLAKQSRNPVNFMDAISSYSTLNRIVPEKTLWIEAGPSSTCIPMAKSIIGLSLVHSMPSLSPREDSWTTLSKSLAIAYSNGFDIGWNAMHKEYEPHLNLLQLPHYAFDLKSYWLQYKGDWTIRKCDGMAEIEPTPRQSFSSTTLQTIESEDFNDGHSNVVFLSNLAEPKLNAAVAGHMVNGVALCPSSIFADMAFTSAAYIWKSTEEGDLPALDVSSMEVSKPLILQSHGSEQLVRVTASRISKSGSITVKIASQVADSSGLEYIEHAQCKVHFGNGDEWKKQWAKQAYLIQDRISSLSQAATEGTIHRTLRSMAYKLFATFVDYSAKFQGMEEVFLNSQLMEASAKVKFRTDKDAGTFTYAPYWIDSLAHLTGYTLNVSETVPDDTVYVSHGWESMRIAGNLSETGNYQTYVRMQETDARNVMAGDLYVLENSEIIAVFEDVKFSAIKKKLLQTLLPQNGAILEKPLALRSIDKKPHDIIIPKKHQEDMVFSEVISCISEETGIPENELTDTTELTDLGIDSLMSLLILNKLGEISQINIPNTIFMCCQTIGELRQQLQELFSIGTQQKLSFRLGTETCLTPVSTNITENVPTNDNFADTFKSIIASEAELQAEDIHPDVLFSDLGIDSLFGLSIINTVYDQTGIRLPSSFFLDHPTFADVQKAFASESRASSIPSTPGFQTQQKNTNGLSDAPRCTSVLLQGKESSSLPALFLLPDGSGSAGSYLGLPTLNSGIRVFGINSPFLHCPEKLSRMTVHGLAALYVKEILKLDPEGPYILGGWSIGGTYAYEAAQILRGMNKSVIGLILIDAPSPGTVPPISRETVDLLHHLGIFADAEARRPRKPDGRDIRIHFSGSIDVLKSYRAVPMIAANIKSSAILTSLPKCVAIWARNGVWESVDESERKRFAETMDEVNENLAQKWIMDPRREFGGNGWEKLMVGVRGEVVDGNHFSIMKSPQIENVGKVIEQSLAGFL